MLISTPTVRWADDAELTDVIRIFRVALKHTIFKARSVRACGNLMERAVRMLKSFPFSCPFVWFMTFGIELHADGEKGASLR